MGMMSSDPSTETVVVGWLPADVDVPDGVPGIDDPDDLKGHSAFQ
jgi:hypothetical protein